MSELSLSVSSGVRVCQPEQPLTAHRSPLTAHSSQLTAHSSQLTAHNSQLTTHNSPSHRALALTLRPHTPRTEQPLKMPLLTHSLTRPLTHSLTHPPTHPPTYSPAYLPTYLLTSRPTYLPTYLLSLPWQSVELEAVDCSVYAPLELTLPAAVDESAGRAKFDRKARALTLRLPLLQTSVVSEAEGELV